MAETKRKRLLTSAWDETAQTVTYGFAGYPDEAPITVKVGEYPDAIKVCGMLHGIEQKQRDAVAGQVKELGEAGFIELFRKTVADMDAMFRRGEWTERGEGSPRDEGLLYQALSRLKPQTMPTAEAARTWFNAQTETIQGQIRKVAAVVEMIGRIKAEKATAAAEKTADGAAALDAIA